MTFVEIGNTPSLEKCLTTCDTHTQINSFPLTTHLILNATVVNHGQHYGVASLFQKSSKNP